VLVSFSAGAGFALMLSVNIGAYLWYSSRPKVLPPWNTEALKATFDHLENEEWGELFYDDTGKPTNHSFGTKKLTFYSFLENTTGLDYQCPQGEEIELLYPNYAPAGCIIWVLLSAVPRLPRHRLGDDLKPNRKCLIPEGLKARQDICLAFVNVQPGRCISWAGIGSKILGDTLWKESSGKLTCGRH
jgi:hypothetical protein